MSRKPHKKIFSDSERARMFKLHKEGISNPVIAERFGITSPRVSQLLAEQKRQQAQHG